MNTNDVEVKIDRKITPQYFFLSFGVLVSLIVTITAFINLIFETLDRAFPDALTSVYTYGYNSYNNEGVRTALAIVIIFFPLFIFLSKKWTMYSNSTLTAHNRTLRKWIIFFVLFLVTLTAAIDLVVLIRYFLSGEITTRFILKVLTIFAVASLVYWQYISELKRELESPISSKYSWLKISVASLLVVCGVVYSFSIIGTPATQRAYRMDQRRVDDLSNIQQQVITFWQQKQKLPESLTEVVDPLQNWQSVPKDPEFQKGLVYEYKKTGDKSFDLCATFTKPIPQGLEENNPSQIYMDKMSASPVGGAGDNWVHQAGRVCFSRTIDVDRYPPFTPNPKAI
jgi:hypothetical protein